MIKVHVIAPVWGPSGRCVPGDVIEIADHDLPAMEWAVEVLEDTNTGGEKPTRAKRQRDEAV